MSGSESRSSDVASIDVKRDLYVLVLESMKAHPDVIEAARNTLTAANYVRATDEQMLRYGVKLAGNA